MRRQRRKILLAIVSLVLLLLLCLDTIDRSPYLRASYFRETREALLRKSATNDVLFGQIYAGVGRARLTPTLNASSEDPAEGRFRSIPLAGYGARKGRPATGTHDELFAKAVAIRVGQRIGIIVSADALIIPREVADAAAKRLWDELGLHREQLYFSATHTHCSIGGWGEGFIGEAFAGEFNPGVRTWFTSQLVSAARAAVDDLKPSSFAHGKFDAPAFIRNRLVGELGQVDDDFSFAVFNQSGGTTAVLGAFGAHATVLGATVMEFSGDYPGYWQRAIEESSGGMALFMSGSVGSHAPVPGRSGFEGAELMGKKLAEQTLAAVRQAKPTNQAVFGLIGADVQLPPLHVRVTTNLRLRPWLAQFLVPVKEASFMQGFRMGNSVWISTPCDFSGELALPLKDALNVRGFNAAITSFNGDYVGYVVPGKYYHLGGYEPRVMSFFGPNLADYFAHLIGMIDAELTAAPLPP